MSFKTCRNAYHFKDLLILGWCNVCSHKTMEYPQPVEETEDSLPELEEEEDPYRAVELENAQND